MIIIHAQARTCIHTEHIVRSSLCNSQRLRAFVTGHDMLVHLRSSLYELLFFNEVQLFMLSMLYVQAGFYSRGNKM